MSKPNILMIMADQFRADWMGCAGADFVDTPNIDFIANNGTRFTRAACNGPLCAPSRASLAAGLYPHRVGVLENDVNFPQTVPTYYQALRSNGYRVAVTGKTDLHKPDHFNGRNGDLPLMYNLGFTDPLDTEGKVFASVFSNRKNKVNSAPELAGPYQRFLKDKGTLDKFMEDYNYRMHKAPEWYAEPSALHVEDYQDSYIGLKACEYLESVSDESPWHMFVSFVGPHHYWDAPLDYLKLYECREFPQMIDDTMDGKPNWIRAKRARMTDGMTNDDFIKVKKNYAAMIKVIDEWIGRILDVLRERKTLHDTIIIFCADHGEMMGDKGLFQKSVMYESAIRVPLIISWKGRILPQTSEVMAELVDLYPTILELAGVGISNEGLDGKSLVSVLFGQEKKHKDYQISELRNTRMIFDGRYKLIESYNDLYELYDLENDPLELNNIFESNSNKVIQLKKAMRELRK